MTYRSGINKPASGGDSVNPDPTSKLPSTAADPVTTNTFQQPGDAVTFSTTHASRSASCRLHDQKIHGGAPPQTARGMTKPVSASQGNPLAANPAFHLQAVARPALSWRHHRCPHCSTGSRRYSRDVPGPGLRVSTTPSRTSRREASFRLKRSPKPICWNATLGGETHPSCRLVLVSPERINSNKTSPTEGPGIWVKAGNMSSVTRAYLTLGCLGALAAACLLAFARSTRLPWDLAAYLAQSTTESLP